MISRPVLRTGLVAALVLALAVVPAAFAGKGGKPGGGGGGGKPPSGGSCTPSAPGISVDNTWGWSAWGSYGVAGQQLTYAFQVRNYDVGCSSSSFVVEVSAPNGFSVTVPVTTVTLASLSSTYLWAYVTSPIGIANGDHPLVFTVRRATAASSEGTFTSWYKVYSSDSVAPTLYWASPGEGQTVTGRSFTATVSARDDRFVKEIEISIDDAYGSTTRCDGVAYTCQASYTWSVGARGAHTATFRARDWLGNVSTTTTTFTVG